eukprot:5813573-Amphidinium_carterae.1
MEQAGSSIPGANFSRIQMEIIQIDGITRDTIVEGSKPGYFRDTLIQAGMEKGRAVGTAGMKSAKTLEAEEYIGEAEHKVYRSVCGRLQFTSPRRPDILFTLKELGRGLTRPLKSQCQLMRHLMRYLRGSTETVLVHMCAGTDRAIIKAQADSDWAGCHSTRKSTRCGMIWWSGVLILSCARTQSTIATSFAESEYYGACAVASEAIYVKELL